MSVESQILKTIDNYSREKHHVLFRKFCKNLAGAKSNIYVYNNWVNNIVPKQISNMSFVHEGSEIPTKVLFTFVKYIKPAKSPQFCRVNNKPYNAKIIINVNINSTNNGVAVIKDENIELGYIPVMIGSDLCLLKSMTEHELIKIGECISDPGGYFIIKSERSIVTQEKTRMSIPLIYKDKGILKLKYTYPINYTNLTNSVDRSIAGVIEIKVGKKWSHFKIKDCCIKSKQKFIPIFVIFKLLLNIDPVTAINNYIFKYVPKKYHYRAMLALANSIVKTNNISDIEAYMNRKRFGSTRNETLEEIRSNFCLDLFKNIYYDDEDITITCKINQYSYFIARFILYYIGVYQPDSRDNWGNKRYDSAGKSMEILFHSIINNKILNPTKNSISNSTTGIEPPYYKSLVPHLKQNISKGKTSTLRKEFESSFNSESWGISSFYKKENITETTQRGTPLALWSQTSKNNTPISRKAKNTDIREVHPSQRCRHCIAETPEGVNNGLIKYDCITSTFSLERDEEDIMDSVIDSCLPHGNICVMLNGKLLYHKGSILYGNEDTEQKLRQMKIYNKIPYDTEIYYDSIMEIVYVYIDGSRILAPFLTISEHNLVIDSFDSWDETFECLISNGSIEFLSVREETSDNILICNSVEKFYDHAKKLKTLKGKDRKEYLSLYNYTHCNLDPVQMLSVSTAVAPLTNHQPGPRNTYQASMGKQALGEFSTNYHLKMVRGFKRLIRATRSFTETDFYFLPKMDLMPSGQTVNIAFYPDPDNQEDAIVISEDCINSGMFNYFKYTTITYIRTNQLEQIKYPDNVSKYKEKMYKNIGKNGLPKLDVFISEGECIIGKQDHKGVNTSIITGIGESGYVDRVYMSNENENTTIIKIKLRKKRKYISGDKLALRYSQKGTIGRVEKSENMIRVCSGHNKGIVPDIYFNPHGFPSRQTMGLLMEGLLTKSILYEGTRVDVSAFRKINIDKAQDILKSNTFDENGYEEMQYPDGNKLRNKIFMVPLYEQVLKHQVLDKIQMRSTGIRSLYTHQPKGGRQQGGGQRIGEMEKDAFVAHGCTEVIKERLMKVSDEFKVIVCMKCGTIPDTNKCKTCSENKLGVLTIPYVFKQLLNFLTGLGISINIHTKLKDEF